MSYPYDDTLDTSIPMFGKRSIDDLEAERLERSRAISEKIKALAEDDPQRLELQNERSELRRHYDAQKNEIAQLWRQKRYTEGAGKPNLDKGAWLIHAGSIPNGSGFYWLDAVVNCEKIREALRVSYKNDKFHVSNHGTRYYIWKH